MEAADSSGLDYHDVNDSEDVEDDTEEGEDDVEDDVEEGDVMTGEEQTSVK
jgi:hypothetical protein